MEMPLSDICWLIEFIATIWETLTSSFLIRPQSCLCRHLWQSNWDLCRGASFFQEEINLTLPQITTSCPILARAFAELSLHRIPAVVRGASGSLGGSPCTDISPCLWFGRPLQRDPDFCMSITGRSWQLSPTFGIKTQHKLLPPVTGSYKGAWKSTWIGTQGWRRLKGVFCNKCHY